MFKSSRILTIAIALVALVGASAGAAQAAPVKTLADQTVIYETNEVPGRFVLTQKRVDISPTKRFVLRLTLYSDPQRDGTIEKIETLTVDYAKKGFRLRSFVLEPQHNQGRLDLRWNRKGQPKKVRTAAFIGRDDHLFRLVPDANA